MYGHAVAIAIIKLVGNLLDNIFISMQAYRNSTKLSMSARYH